MAKYLVPPPPSIERALLSALLAWRAADATGDWQLGFVEMKRLYSRMLRAQGEGERLHKGLPLHNMGHAIISGAQGSMVDALRYTTMAFLEDALSEGEKGQGRLSELDGPAARNLVYVFGVPGRVLIRTAMAVRAVQDAPQLLQNPRLLLRRVQVSQVLLTAQMEARLVGQMHSPWERRVFLGGSYAMPYLERLQHIRDVIEDIAWDGVIALDFAVPGEMSWATHEMMLMHECSSAVFDMSVRGGHEAEFLATPTLRLPDQRILLVFDSTVPDAPAVSGATRDDWEVRGFTPVGYATTDDLAASVRRFLEALPTPRRRRA